MQGQAAFVIFSSVGLCIGRMGVGVGGTGLGRVAASMVVQVPRIWAGQDLSEV